MSPLPLWFRDLTPELVKHAENTLGETPELRRKKLAEFRKLIQGRPDIFYREEDVFLLRFLRAKKFDVEKSFKTFCNYHSVMTNYRGVFTGKLPSEMRHVLEMNTITYAPFRLPPSSSIGIYRMGCYDLDKASPADMIAMQFVISELLYECEANHICGGIYIVDTQGMSLRHYTSFISFKFLSLVVRLLQDAWPARITDIHFVHEPPLLHALYPLLKPLMSKKFRERIWFHGNDLDSLHKHVPKDFLPEEIGGNLGPFDNSEFSSYILSQEAHFKKNREYGIV